MEAATGRRFGVVGKPLCLFRGLRSGVWRIETRGRGDSLVIRFLSLKGISHAGGLFVLSEPGT